MLNVFCDIIARRVNEIIILIEKHLGGVVKMLEKDMYLPIKKYFEEKDYIVRGEVGQCDLVALKGEELIMVEMKKSISVKLLIQGAKRQRTGDCVYIAVPKPKKFRINRSNNDLFHLIRRLELGLLFVSFNQTGTTVKEMIRPKSFDRSRSVRAGRKAREKMMNEVKDRSEDYNVGGSTRTKLMTAYREKALHIAVCLERYGRLSTKDLRNYGTDTKKTTTILYQNHYGWFRRQGRGIYELTQKGIEDLEEYNQVTDYYKKKLDTHKVDD